MKTLLTNGLKSQKAVSPGQRPGYKDMGKFALKGQKLYPLYYAFALLGRPCHAPQLLRTMPWADSFQAFQAVFWQNNRNFRY